MTDPQPNDPNVPAPDVDPGPTSVAPDPGPPAALPSEAAVEPSAEAVTLPAATAEPPANRSIPGWLSIVGGAIVPGLGHLLLGRRRRAAILFAPVVALAAVAGVVLVAAPDRAELAGELLTPEALEALAVIVVAVGLYRLAVLGATFVLAARLQPVGRLERLGRAFLTALLAVAIAAPHIIAGAVIVDTRQTIMDVFDPADLGETGDGAGSELIPPLEPDGTNSPAPSGSTIPAVVGPSARPTRLPTPSPSPTATPDPGPAWAADGRLNVLLIGADAGPDRWSLRTDTMILLSVDVATGRAAMFGFPRNMTGAPLPKESAGAVPGGRFPDLLNAIYVYANAHPSQFPGGNVRGFRAIGGTIQKLSGVALDGIAVVNLNGFVRLVDALGGVTIDIPEPLFDDHYPLEGGSGDVSISFHAGVQHLNGHRALMYARSRHQDSDYGRMARQQAVLLALRSRLKPCKLIPRIPTLLKIAQDDAWTSFSVRDLPSLLSLAARTDTKHVRSVMFAPPTFPAFITDAEIAHIHQTVRTIFPTITPAPTMAPPPILAPEPMEPTPGPTDDPDPCA